MPIFGMPAYQEPPTPYTVDTFKIYMKEFVDYLQQNDHMLLYNECYNICKTKINYGYFLEEYNLAMSLAIAHYISTLDPESTQAVGQDPLMGTVMSSLSVGGMSYNYDSSNVMWSGETHKFWNTTGYGRALCALAESRPRIPFIVAR